MNIVILDAHTINPGDLSWEELKKLGSLTVYERTSPHELLDRAQSAEILLTNKTVLDRTTIEQVPELKYIGVLATGYNVVDMEAATERSITVTNVPVYSTDSVVQMVFAHILNFCNGVQTHADSVRKGDWTTSKDFCYSLSAQREIAGSTLGIIGLGSIGSKVATTATSLGMKVIVHRHSGKPCDYPLVGLETLFRESDFISIHCPLTENNKAFVNTDLLHLMKPTAFLVNTSRGPLINEQALANALNSQQIAGAGLDVLSTEPPSPNNPLLQAKNCTITPHNAWATHATRKRLIEIATDNLSAFIASKPVNTVN